VEGLFTSKKIKFHLSQYLENALFLELCKGYTFKIDSIEKHKSIEKRPNILITSSLQQKAHQLLGFSPAQTMSYAQALYENGCITYMRTDTPVYSDTFKLILERFIKKKYGDPYYKEIPNTVKKAHEGIRVTDLTIVETTFETKQINKLYSLIYKHTLQTSMSDCIMEHIHYKMNAPMDLHFIYKEPTVIFSGWKDSVKSETNQLYLSLLGNMEYHSITCKEILETPVYHYCESQIIQKLEKAEIGRPSTYSSILTKLYDKHYIIKGKISGKVFETTHYSLMDHQITKTIEPSSNDETNKISITETGKKVVEFCYEYYNHLFDYEYTKEMEKQLDIIAETGKWKDIFIEFKRAVDKEVVIDRVKPPQKSLHCGIYKKHPVIIKHGQFGYYVEYNKTTLSLLKWHHYDKIDTYIEQQTFPPELLESIMDKRIDPYTSIKTGKYGDYIYHKTPKMKKPKFYKLEIESRDIKDIKEYLQKKYNLII
jgi:DNA topoisomerase-1